MQPIPIAARKGLLLALAASLASGCVGPSAQVPEVSSEAEREEVERQKTLAVDSMIEQHRRLFEVAWPVAARGVEICGEDSKPGGGYLVAEPEHFPEHLRQAMRERYGLESDDEGKKGEDDGQNAGGALESLIEGAVGSGSEDGPRQFVVISVARMSAAERAGMQVGDVVVSLNGENFEGGSKLKGDGEENLFVLMRDGERIEISLVAESMCKYPIGLVFDSQVNAFADGENVIVTSGLMRALTDSQVQVVVAHEIAHNLRRHIDAQKTNAAIGSIIDLAVILGTGVNLGMRNIAVMHHSEGFEAEADYVAMYILAAADFELEQVPDIWRRMTVLNPAVDQSKASIFGRTHPTNAQRFVAMEKAIEEIRAKQAAGEPLLPNFNDE